MIGAPFSEEVCERAARLLDRLRHADMRLATVESCTGGLIAALLTEIPGSSDVVMAGLVTYSNSAKSELAGVPVAAITAHGAVSSQVADAMVRGALDRLHDVTIAVGVTGIAGPSGGSAEKPVGLVYMAVARRAATGGITVLARRHVFQVPPDQASSLPAGPSLQRTLVRLSAVDAALDLIEQAVDAADHD